MLLSKFQEYIFDSLPTPLLSLIATKYLLSNYCMLSAFPTSENTSGNKTVKSFIHEAFILLRRDNEINKENIWDVRWC